MNEFTPNNVLTNISTIPKFDIYMVLKKDSTNNGYTLCNLYNQRQVCSYVDEEDGGTREQEYY